MNYWDTSAIIHSLALGRLDEIKGVTRSHTLAEFYSRTTGKGFKILVEGREKTAILSPDLAADRIASLAAQLKFVDLTPKETSEALSLASKQSIRGGRIHDFLHIQAASKAGVAAILTFNEKDFAPHTKIPLKHPPG